MAATPMGIPIDLAVAVGAVLDFVSSSQIPRVSHIVEGAPLQQWRGTYETLWLSWKRAESATPREVCTPFWRVRARLTPLGAAAQELISATEGVQSQLEFDAV